MGEIPVAVEAELARLRAENAWLLKLLKLTPQQAAPPGPAQAAFFEAAPGIVHHRSPQDTKVAFFGALFAARTDVYAVRYDNAHTGKGGWIPAVRGGWRKGVRHEDRGYLPLTPGVLAAHLKGEAHIGLYPLLDGDRCWWLAADFDGPEAMFDALMYVKAGRALQVPVALEVSRSGVGAHAWVFFTAPVPAEKIRGDERGQSRECGPTTQLRIFATLRAALNAAVRQRKITWNPCDGVELEHPDTAERQRWTPVEAARFIAFIADDEMGLMFRVAVLRAPRRAELCGFRWADSDMEKPYPDPRTGKELTGALLGVERPIIQLGGKLVKSKAKTKRGQRRIFLDHETAELLRQHRRAQLRLRLTAGEAWQDNDLVFCQEDGRPWNPDHVSKRFKKLAALAGVRVISLHEGGRHTGNSLMQDAGVDQELRMREVGHADRSVNDRYTHPLEQAHLAAAEQTAALVRNARTAA